MAIRSEAQKKAVAKYNAKNYEQLIIRVPKGDKEKIQVYAESKGESVNSYVNGLIREDMQKNENA